MIKVLIVEDQRLVRERLEEHIENDSRFELAGSISNAALAEIICMQNQVDLVLMDVCTDADESGLVAAEKIKKNSPDIKIVIITSMPEHSFISRARDIGVESFWYKDIGKEEIVDIMVRTVEGESCYPKKTAEVTIGQASSYEFTSKELEVLRLVVEGKTYTEISDELHISVETVKYHIKNMLSKTGYSTKTRLAVAVTNKKLIITDF